MAYQQVWCVMYYDDQGCVSPEVVKVCINETEAKYVLGQCKAFYDEPEGDIPAYWIQEATLSDSRAIG